MFFVFHVVLHKAPPFRAGSITSRVLPRAYARRPASVTRESSSGSVKALETPGQSRLPKVSRARRVTIDRTHDTGGTVPGEDRRPSVGRRILEGASPPAQVAARVAADHRLPGAESGRRDRVQRRASLRSPPAVVPARGNAGGRQARWTDGLGAMDTSPSDQVRPVVGTHGDLGAASDLEGQPDFGRAHSGSRSRSRFRASRLLRAIRGLRIGVGRHRGRQHVDSQKWRGRSRGRR